MAPSIFVCPKTFMYFYLSFNKILCGTCINISFNNRAKHILHVSRIDVIFNVMFCFDEAFNLYVVLNFWGM